MSSLSRCKRVTYSCWEILCVSAFCPAVVFSSSTKRASTPAAPFAFVLMISNAMDTCIVPRPLCRACTSFFFAIHPSITLSSPPHAEAPARARTESPTSTCVSSDISSSESDAPSRFAKSVATGSTSNAARAALASSTSTFSSSSSSITSSRAHPPATREEPFFDPTAIASRTRIDKTSPSARANPSSTNALARNSRINTALVLAHPTPRRSMTHACA
mmetsp:Transcript_7190/g.26285  ORF Transcript_7190/g.26285 Transcript_7190/m.26285 type:complete len:218 (+) Transcript_7190:3748-4401(+)